MTKEDKIVYLKTIIEILLERLKDKEQIITLLQEKVYEMEYGSTELVEVDLDDPIEEVPPIYTNNETNNEE